MSQSQIMQGTFIMIYTYIVLGVFTIVLQFDWPLTNPDSQVYICCLLDININNDNNITLK